MLSLYLNMIGTEVERKRFEEVYYQHRKQMVFIADSVPHIIDDDYDWSYPAAEMQLLWRLDDLQDRLEELITKDAPYRDGYMYSEDDIRYALPERLFDIGKVERAIEFIKDELVNKYGLPDPDSLILDESESADNDCVGQMTMFDLLHEKLPKVA